MTRLSYWAAVVLLLGGPAVASADSPLTLDAAVQAAVAHNASLRAARAGVDAASAGADQARSGFFPRILFSESWQRGDQPVFVFSSLLASRRFAASNFAIDALNHPDPTGFFRASLGVEQLLFDGGRQRAAARAAGLGRDIAQALTDEATQALIVATTDTFGRILRGDAGQRSADGSLATAREDLARTGRRRDAGRATDGDVLALAARLAELEQRSIQSRGDAAIARAELNRLMGAPIDASVDIVPPSTDVDVTADTPVVDLLAEAGRTRPELRRAAAAVLAAEAAKREARAAFIPEVAAQAAVDLSGTQFNDRTSSWIVGGELRWRFSTGGGEAAGMRAAAARLIRAQAEQDAARADVDVDVVTALRRVESARARRDAGRAAVAQARESERVVRDRFDAGLAQVGDVLRASSAVLDAEADATSALVDTVVGAAALRRALGRVQ